MGKPCPLPAKGRFTRRIFCAFVEHPPHLACRNPLYQQVLCSRRFCNENCTTLAENWFGKALHFSGKWRNWMHYRGDLFPAYCDATAAVDHCLGVMVWLVYPQRYMLGQPNNKIGNRIGLEIGASPGGLEGSRAGGLAGCGKGK